MPAVPAADQTSTTQNFSVGNDGSRKMARVLLDDTMQTYRVSATFTPTATGAVTLVSVQGSATKTIRVKRFQVCGYGTALSNSVFALQRTSALGAGGTTVSPTVGKLDTQFNAATAVVSHYTSTLKAAGTAVGGPLSTWLQFTGTVTTPATAVMSPQSAFPEQGAIGQGIVLRGTADYLELQNIAPANLAAGTLLQYVVEWVEDDS